MEKTAQNKVLYTAKRLGVVLVIFVILIMNWNFHLSCQYEFFLSQFELLSNRTFIIAKRLNSKRC